MTPQKDAHTHRLLQQLVPKVPWEGSGWMSSAKHRLIKQADQSTGKSQGPTVLDPGVLLPPPREANAAEWNLLDAASPPAWKGTLPSS